MLLALETSRAQPAFALGAVDADPICKGLQAEAGQAASTALLGEVQQVLSELGHVGPAPVWSAIAVSQGPGAFTGLRVGCAVAQGLAMPGSSPIVPVPTLLAVAAASWPASRCPVAVVMDARMNERYVAWARPEPCWTLDTVQLLAAADVAAWLHDTAPATGEWLAAGDGWGHTATLPVPHAPLPLLIEQVRAVWMLGREALHRGNTLDAALIAPVYVRDRVAYTTAERASGLGGNPQAALWSAR